jgi:hypothetical protein
MVHGTARRKIGVGAPSNHPETDINTDRRSKGYG